MAVVLIPATSEPAQGSVTAKAIIFSPLNTGPQYLSFNSSHPFLSKGGNPIATVPNPHTKPLEDNFTDSSIQIISWK